MIPAFSSQIEEEEPAEQTENRLQGVGDQGRMVSKNPRHDGSQEVGRCVGQRLEQMCALDLATWRPGLSRGAGACLEGEIPGWWPSTGAHMESLGGTVSGLWGLSSYL